MHIPGGLKIDEITLGVGAIARPGAYVGIEWRGWLNWGDPFGDGVVSFRIGQRRVVAGLERGIIGMRVGGVRRLRVSPHLGYRDRAVSGVPANAVLNFEIKLLEVGESDQ
jgi:FKBP-type peptidyl-prolyl cis-trans isomerase